jgi:hypothetical protein
MKRLLFAAMTAPAYPCFLQVMPLTLEPEAAIEKASVSEQVGLLKSQ